MDSGLNNGKETTNEEETKKIISENSAFCALCL